MKKATAIQIVLILLLSITACQKEDNMIKGLDGTWIEVDTQTDTIVFKTNYITGSLVLNRGFETLYGHYMPKMGSGPYAYEIYNDSIMLESLLSSTVYGRKYFFKFIESTKTFDIGVFTAFSTDKARLTFRKIE